MKPKIIYEDDSLLILDKPAGWIVNEAETTKDQPVVQRWLKNNLQFPILNSQLLRSGIVHRLDKETSGILVIAKTEKAFKNLQGQFKKRKVEKRYIALVHGKVEPEKGSIKVPVGRLPWNRERFGVLPGGREAETGYKIISNYQLAINNNEELTLLELKPKTGRTHQIRVHLKYLRHPVISDSFYAGRKTSRGDRGWCPRLFLHASEIKFAHPKTSKSMRAKSELPGDLLGVLDTLKVQSAKS